MPKATATEIRSGSGMESIAVVALPDGSTAEVSIPGDLCLAITNAVQSLLLKSLAISQMLGGIALLSVSTLAHRSRDNEEILLMQTETLGAIGLQLTPLQWKTLREIALKVQPDSRGIH